MATSESKRVSLDAKGTKRMETLSREIHSRLEEMASIMAKSLDIDLGSAANLKFAPKRAAAGELALRHIEIFELPDGTYGCYDSEAAMCVYPC
jgi:hypothetical protein